MENMAVKFLGFRQYAIPEGFAHGYSVLSDSATVVYLQSGDYSPEHDGSINPLSLDIDWKVEKPDYQKIVQLLHSRNSNNNNVAL